MPFLRVPRISRTRFSTSPRRRKGALAQSSRGTRPTTPPASFRCCRRTNSSPNSNNSNYQSGRLRSAISEFPPLALQTARRRLLPDPAKPLQNQSAIPLTQAIWPMAPRIRILVTGCGSGLFWTEPPRTEARAHRACGAQWTSVSAERLSSLIL